MKTKRSKNLLSTVLCGFGMLFALCATGCQGYYGGQILPSAYYLTDDVQYHPTGTEFKLSEEAAMMERFQTEQAELGN